MKSVYVPWLHMHQPFIWKGESLIGNIEKMLESDDQKESWEAKAMLRAYKNPAKYVELLRKNNFKAKIMLDFSGILLENLEKIKHKLKRLEINGEFIGDIIKFYKEVMEKYPGSIEFAGTAYSHCYFPVTPKTDWEYQVQAWRETFEKLFGKKFLNDVKGFWLPEMGVPGRDIEKLIKVLKEFGYEWIILPIEAIKDEKKMSFEERIIKTSQPHIIKSGDESITAIFRVRYDFIDQQAGCDANGVYEKSILASQIFSKVSDKPALVVPASDGENGNVIMNEFFPSTFERFFKEKIDENVSSMTITEFLREFYPRVDSQVELAEEGSSWIGSHKNWQEGDERLKINSNISKLSERFRVITERIQGVSDKNIIEKYKQVKKFLLITETSCYTYWGTDFWFNQAYISIKKLESLMEELQYILDRKLYFKKNKLF